MCALVLKRECRINLRLLHVSCLSLSEREQHTVANVCVVIIWDAIVIMCYKIGILQRTCICSVFIVNLQHIIV